jgi:hypothetical protein
MLRRSLDDALDTLRSVAEFDFPDVEFNHELLSLADGERYPIENGTIKSNRYPTGWWCSASKSSTPITASALRLGRRSCARSGRSHNRRTRQTAMKPG